MLKLADKDPTNVLKKITYSSSTPHTLSRTTNPSVVCIESGQKKFRPFQKQLVKFEFHGRWKNSYAQARFLLYLNVGFRGTFSVRTTDCKSYQNMTPYVAMARSRPAHLYIATCMQFLGHGKKVFLTMVFFSPSEKIISQYAKRFGNDCRSRITGQAWILLRIITDERAVISAFETVIPDLEHAG